jgi:hypothetical protein
MGKYLDKLGFENPLDHRKSKNLKSAYRNFYFLKFVYRNTYTITHETKLLSQQRDLNHFICEI